MGGSYPIAVIPGDGIGPEVVSEALRVLERVAQIEGFTAPLTHYPFGADHYLATQEVLPDSAFEEIQGHAAILLGAIGDPRVSVGLSRVRHHRPPALRPRPLRQPAAGQALRRAPLPAQGQASRGRRLRRGAREHRGRLRRHARPLQEGHARRDRHSGDPLHAQGHRARHPLRLRAGATPRPRRKKLTLVDKANAVRAMDLWTRTFEEVGREYPDIAREHAYIDAACMWCVKNPEWFDVGGHQQHVRRHPHRPGGHGAGRHGHRGLGQHPSRPREPVRADPRLGAQVRRARTSANPIATIMAVPDDARLPRRDPRGDANRGGGGGPPAFEAHPLARVRLGSRRPARSATW